MLKTRVKNCTMSRRMSQQFVSTQFVLLLLTWDNTNGYLAIILVKCNQNRFLI